MKKDIQCFRLKIILLILLVFRIVLVKLNQGYDLYILVFGINQSVINFLLYISMIIITAFIINYYIKNKMKYVISILAVVSIGILLFYSFLFNCEKGYFYFESPDKSRTLVVEEDSFLFWGGSNFYEKKGEMFIRDLKSSISTDDGYKPFSNNHYNLKWLDNNSVELNYDAGTGSAEYSKIIIKLD